MILWARRNPALKFLGGFHSFAGGKVDESDVDADIRNCRDNEQKTLLACAAREVFEEIGVLLVRNGDRLTKGQLPILHVDLLSGRSTFAEILNHWGLWIDAGDFTFAGVWTTPEFSRVRFRTTFFVARCPAKQTPYAAISELQDIEFIDPGDALDRWSRSEVLIAPPVLKTLKAFEQTGTASGDDADFASACAKFAADRADGPHYLELNSRLVCFPVRTKTLPPATHTNCYISGGKRFVVIDAATPFEDEQRKLIDYVSERLEMGDVCEAIIVSHLHPDHFGGETTLKKDLRERFGVDVPIIAHEITIESLRDKVRFDDEIKDSYRLQDSAGAEFKIDVIHTPGHARGHLCFYDEEFGFLLSSDNIVGEGSVVIAPPEGNMSDYLESLEKMRSLPGLRSLAGSHGAAVCDAKSKINRYLEHRFEREEQVYRAIIGGASDFAGIVAGVYADLDPILLPLAEKSVEAHVERLIEERRISSNWDK